jgi:3-oxoacyl-[acyl-carrier protein] reductase
MKNILIFGASGCISQDLIKQINTHYPNYTIYGTTSNLTKISKNTIYFNIDNLTSINNLKKLPIIDICIWAHGYNVNDKIGELDINKYLTSMNVNVNYISISIDYMIKNNLLNCNARLCVISSIWQEYVRSGKFSYSVSKSAISGLIKSISSDLQDKNILINAILPGPIDNKMTRGTLTIEQIERIKINSGFNRLVDSMDIYYLVDYLCFKNNSTTGQSFIVDLGLTVKRDY